MIPEEGHVDKRYRDARTGEYVTAEYAAEHPDTTVSEEHNMTMNDTPQTIKHINVRVVAAVNALSSLLDELDHLETDVAEAEGDAQRYWPFVERAERAEAALARVRELHMESRSSMSALYPNPLCECGKDYPCPTLAAIGGEQS